MSPLQSPDFIQLTLTTPGTVTRVATRRHSMTKGTGFHHSNVVSDSREGPGISGALSAVHILMSRQHPRAY